MNLGVKEKKKMVNERQKKILNLLEERGSLSLHELIDYCEVSEATIRRDLTSLEEKNLLYRTHGGAMKRTTARGSEIGVEAKRTEFLPEKKEVAKYLCKNVVQSGQTIYLDAGTSTYEMIDYLRDRKITVVTNSTYHLPRLINNKIHTIILGGTLKHSTQAVIGHTAIEQLKNYSFDMCFVGCTYFNQFSTALLHNIWYSELSAYFYQLTSGYYYFSALCDSAACSFKPLRKLSG